MARYPSAATARDRFVLDRRPDKTVHDPWTSPSTTMEIERAADGSVARTATIFLTGRQCPWHCVMCDLWQHTIDADTPDGAIPAQIGFALAALDAQGPRPDVLKLYNAGSFFDPRAVPPGDYPAVVDALGGVSQLVVESHPSLVGPGTERLAGLATRAGMRLEVAMGLETVHPAALEELNKRMTLADFTHAAHRLRAIDVSIRAFLLVCPPFVAAAEQDDWLGRSVDFAFACGVGVVSLIPTRRGNGALDELETSGDFTAPRLADLERSLSLALARRRPPDARVFADLWDVERLGACAGCLESRVARLHRMNLEQRDLPPARCADCEAA